MRDWWYGDKRDIIKWGAIIHLAQKHSINSILQVAFYRAERKKHYLTIDGTDEPLPFEVIQHFRDIDQITRLEETTKIAITIHKEFFEWDAKFRTRNGFRESYFNELTRKIQAYLEPVIVLLDPDTGIAPETYSFEHVTAKEIQMVLREMKRTDILLFYQHARLGDVNWQNSTRKAFCKAVGQNVQVETITCKTIAHDVAFFMVKRST